MSGQPYAGARLLLDYMKVFTWPLAILIILVLYQSDIRVLINEREFEFFGVKAGARIGDIKENVEQELADIRSLLDTILAEDTSTDEKNRLAEVTLLKVDSFQQNINKEVAKIQQADRPETVQAGGRRKAVADQEQAKRFEEAGFEAIKRRDFTAAQNSFAAAYKLYPDYHNVDEINRLLQKYQARLQSPDSPAWKLVEKQIITNYSWGLPKDLRGDYRQVISPKK